MKRKLFSKIGRVLLVATLLFNTYGVAFVHAAPVDVSAFVPTFSNPTSVVYEGSATDAEVTHLSNDSDVDLTYTIDFSGDAVRGQDFGLFVDGTEITDDTSFTVSIPKHSSSTFSVNTEGTYNNAEYTGVPKQTVWTVSNANDGSNDYDLSAENVQFTLNINDDENQFNFFKVVSSVDEDTQLTATDATFAKGYKATYSNGTDNDVLLTFELSGTAVLGTDYSLDKNSPSLMSFDNGATIRWIVRANQTSYLPLIFNNVDGNKTVVIDVTRIDAVSDNEEILYADITPALTGSQRHTVTIIDTDAPALPADEANVYTLDELHAALENSTITTIHIKADISDITDAVRVDHTLTINGEGHTLSFTDDLNTAAYGSRSAIIISADDVVLNDVNVQMTNTTGWQGAYGLQAYKVTGVIVHNYSATGGDAALLVNGSEVTLTGTIDVSGNEFGGIELSKGSGVTTEPTLDISGGSLVNSSEMYWNPTIWEDGLDGTSHVTGGNLTRVTGEKPYYYIVEENSYSVDVKNQTELVAALAEANITHINVVADFATTQKKILVDHAVTINGNGHTLSFADDSAGWGSNYLFQVYNTRGVTFSDISLTGGDAALLVNASDVTLTGTVAVSGNEFGGIEVSKGSAQGLENAELDVTSATLQNSTEAYGQPTIWEITGQGIVIGFSGTSTTDVVEGQNQYYLLAANSVENETPVVIATPESMTLFVDDRILVDLSDYFSDPNGDVLSYTHTVGDTAVVTSTVGEGNGEVYFTGLAVGSTDVTFVATDTHGESATTTMTLTVKEHTSGGGSSGGSSSGGGGGVYLPNTAPSAAFASQSVTVAVDTEITFDASDSQDAEDNIQLYFWNFGDGTEDVYGQSPYITHTYTQIGTYTLTVRVRDERGEQDTATLEVTVVNKATGNNGGTNNNGSGNNNGGTTNPGTGSGNGGTTTPTTPTTPSTGSGSTGSGTTPIVPPTSGSDEEVDDGNPNTPSSGNVNSDDEEGDETVDEQDQEELPTWIRILFGSGAIAAIAGAGVAVNRIRKNV